MATLLQIRDAIALSGSAQARQLSQQFSTPLPLIEAMLEQLAAMGKIKRIKQDNDSYLTSSCRSCPEGQKCYSAVYQLIAPHSR